MLTLSYVWLAVIVFSAACSGLFTASLLRCATISDLEDRLQLADHAFNLLLIRLTEREAELKEAQQNAMLAMEVTG